MVGNRNPRSQTLPRTALVIGAGVVGVATAYALARRGVEVTIAESADRPACGASFANGAQLSYAYTDALATPSLLRNLPVLALGLDPAFRLKPRLDPCQIAWLVRFLRNSTGARFWANTLAGLELGMESRQAMHALLDQHQLDFAHRVAGKMIVYQDHGSFLSARRMVERRNQHGAVQEILKPAEAIELEPALAARPSPFAGAIYSPQEELGDPHLFCSRLLEVLRLHYGVVVRMNTTIKDWESGPQGVSAMTVAGERIAVEQLVICAGIDARPLLKGLGLDSALLPMKGYSFTAETGAAAPSMSITDVSRKIVFCPLGGKLRVAGLAELGAHDTRIEHRRLAQLKASATACLPEAADYSATNAGWAGIRPMTANSLPIISRLRPRIAINIGHGMLGWTYAMGSAERVARLIEESA